MSAKRGIAFKEIQAAISVANASRAEFTTPSGFILLYLNIDTIFLAKVYSLIPQLQSIEHLTPRRNSAP